jgi:lipoate-protein ligase A
MNIEKVLSPNGQMKLIDGPNFLAPANEIEIAPRLLRYSIEKSAGTFARIYRPQRTVALTSRDIATYGYDNALAQAENLGFTPVVRSPGGRAVAYHEESLVLDIMSQDPNPHGLINKRFEAIGEIFIETFDRLGISAKLGQVPREFCPGKYSVISENVKLVGTAQRIMRGGWLIGASVIVRNVAPVREVLGNVYRALDLDMDPTTIGALNEFDSTISVDDLGASLISTLKDHFEVMDIELSMNFQSDNRDLVDA